MSGGATPSTHGDDHRHEPAELAWRKATASATGNCVEVAAADTVVFVRSSKDPLGARLAFTPQEWRAFLSSVRDGEFDVVADR